MCERAVFTNRFTQMTKKQAPTEAGKSCPILCAHSAVWPVADLKPNPRNPNKHSAGQIALLAKIISTVGWRAPIVVSKRSGLVVKGHGRLEAAKLAGLTSAPVDVQDYADEAAEMADMIADNRLAELAEMDLPSLKDLLQELDTGALDMELVGFTEEALAQLMSQCAPDAGPVELNEKWEVIVECPNEVSQRAAFEKLTKEGYKCRVLTF